MPHREGSLHLGIYADYGFTPRPDEGIGVFLHSLIDALLQLKPDLQITLWVHPGEEHQAAHWFRHHKGKVAIHPPPIWPWLGRWIDGLRWLRQRWEQGGLLPLSARAQAWLAIRWKRLVDDRGAGHARLSAFASCLAVAALLLPLVWGAAVLHHLLVHGLLRALAFPGEWLLRTAPSDELPPLPPCDVWLIPHGRTAACFNAPEVLVLWDVAHHHVSGVFGGEVAELTDALFAERTRKAALIVCAAHAIRTDDILRLYPQAEERIRVVPLACPRDLEGASAVAAAGACERFGLRRPFIFYPAAIRAHKNHATLVRALAILRESYGCELDLVCTGKGESSDSLQRALDDTGMTRHVRFLGLVNRTDLAALYRLATLTVVPSLHEGYGLPVMEALASGSPLTCADIPALRELLAGHEDAFVFFDPRDPLDVADAMAATLARYYEITQAQAQVHAVLSQRDWQTVAAEYLEVFQEAIARSLWQDEIRPENPPAEVLSHG